MEDYRQKRLQFFSGTLRCTNFGLLRDIPYRGELINQARCWDPGQLSPKQNQDMAYISYQSSFLYEQFWSKETTIQAKNFSKTSKPVRRNVYRSIIYQQTKNKSKALSTQGRRWTLYSISYKTYSCNVNPTHLTQESTTSLMNEDFSIQSINNQIQSQD